MAPVIRSTIRPFLKKIRVGTPRIWYWDGAIRYSVFFVAALAECYDAVHVLLLIDKNIMKGST